MRSYPVLRRGTSLSPRATLPPVLLASASECTCFSHSPRGVRTFPAWRVCSVSLSMAVLSPILRTLLLSLLMVSLLIRIINRESVGPLRWTKGQEIGPGVQAEFGNEANDQLGPHLWNLQVCGHALHMTHLTANPDFAWLWFSVIRSPFVLVTKWGNIFIIESWEMGRQTGPGVASQVTEQRGEHVRCLPMEMP